MSENGPREGTKDLPRSGPDAGRRAVDGGSAAGAVYQSISRRARRRRLEILALVHSGLAPAVAATAYSRDHPLELEVTVREVELAVASEKPGLSKPGPVGR